MTKLIELTCSGHITRLGPVLPLTLQIKTLSQAWMNNKILKSIPAAKYSYCHYLNILFY